MNFNHIMKKKIFPKLVLTSKGKRDSFNLLKPCSNFFFNYRFVKSQIPPTNYENILPSQPLNLSFPKSVVERL